MKKTVTVLLCLCLLLTLFAGCGRPAADPAVTDPATPDGTPAQPLKIVCTVFPIYDWVRAVLGDRADAAELTLLLDSGVDLHSYEPLPEDLLKLSQCDLFIYVGGESDEKWVPDTVESTGVKNELNLLQTLGAAAKEETEVAGMQAEEEEEEEGALDEHIWLSLKNAAALCGSVCDRLCEIDPANAETYRANTDGYVAQLNDLDKQYAETAETSEFRALLVADRFPFRYLCDDYGITPYAAFSGCSTESTAGMGTIAGLAGYLNELGLRHVVVTETSDKATAQAVIDSSEKKDQTIVVLDSLQSVTKARVDAGVTYLQVMRDNLEALKTALN